MDSRSLHSRASHETFISLLQLDPTPIENPESPTDTHHPPSQDDGDTMESSTLSMTKAGSTTAPGLSGSGHGPIYYLTRIQKYSSLGFTIFASIHLANTSIIPLIARSVPASETYLLQAREIYQTPTTEPLLVGLPILAHVLSGVALRLLRRSQNLKRYGGATPGMYALHRSRNNTDLSNSVSSNKSTASNSATQIWPSISYISASGYTFAVLLWAHVGMNRALPLNVEGDSSNIGLAYVAHGFARHGTIAWIAYGGLIAIGCGHMVWGASKWLGLTPTIAPWTAGGGSTVVDRKTRKQRRRFWWAIQTVAVAFAGLWAAGGLGVVARGGLADGWVGKLYDGIYARIPGM